MPFARLWVNRPMWRAMVRRTRGKVMAAVQAAGAVRRGFILELPIASGMNAACSFSGLFRSASMNEAVGDFMRWEGALAEVV